jgi:hypothetical protein
MADIPGMSTIFMIVHGQAVTCGTDNFRAHPLSRQESLARGLEVLRPYGEYEVWLPVQDSLPYPAPAVSLYTNTHKKTVRAGARTVRL